MFRERIVTIYDPASKLNISNDFVNRVLKKDSVLTNKTKKKIYDLGEKMDTGQIILPRNFRNS